MSDPAKYRTREELDSYRQQDPILVLKGQMEKAGRLSAEDYKALDDACKQAADDAVRFAEESPEPAPESRLEDVLA
jgi:pyruvate dehydrogenase E1 component alpha subunit